MRAKKMALVFFLALVAAGISVQWRLQNYFAGLQPSGAFIDVDGHRLHYRMLGTQGPRVIVIHGASGNLLDWVAGPVHKFAEFNRVLLIDRPGLGWSDRASGDAKDPGVQAALMRKAAVKLGFERAIVAGHSYGGAVALAWALDAPETVDGLLLLAAPSQVWKAGPSLRDQIASNSVIGPIAARLIPALFGDKLIIGATSAVFQPQTAPDNYANDIDARLSLRAKTIQANSADVAGLKRFIRKMVPHYETLDMPIELLHGTADTIVPLEVHSRVLATQIPSATLTILDGTGHMPHHANPNEVLAALQRLNLIIGGKERQ